MPVSSNDYLAEYGESMTSNATYIFNYFSAKGWTRNAIAAMLGNMQRESTINPGLWQNRDSGNTRLGFGLVQWTPAGKLINWCNTFGYDYSSIEAQCARIIYELEKGLQYRKTAKYNLTFEEFTHSKTNVRYLTNAFLKNYERAGVWALEERVSHAEYWFDYFYTPTIIAPEFTPRKTSDGMNGAYYWYEGSPFYPTYGLPNCTCYAWGRFWEISDIYGTHDNRPTLSTGNAENWFGNTWDGYERGSYPKLGAVICFTNSTVGHVAIVEEIYENGDILTSNSAWGGSYFYTQVLSAANGYNTNTLTFQGFIYNPTIFDPYIQPEPDPDPEPEPGKEKKKKHFKFHLKNWRKEWTRSNS